MEKHLQALAFSYDKGIDLGRQGINMYDDLPQYIVNDPDYPAYEAAMLMDPDTGSSGDASIISFLAPQKGMEFVDLGCCLNLMLRGYDGWPSTYHGVDISPKTIRLLREYVEKKNLSIGSLNCYSAHKTPFGENTFDIAARIGVLDYFESDFTEAIVAEAHRIIKPGGRLVLDIPNLGSAACRIMMLIEAHLGRPDQFNISVQAFSAMVQNYFEVEHSDICDSNSMVRYFLNRKPWSDRGLALFAAIPAPQSYRPPLSSIQQRKTAAFIFLIKLQQQSTLSFFNSQTGGSLTRQSS